MAVRQHMTSHQFNPSYLDSNSWQLWNTGYYSFDMGCFEAFKSSGNQKERLAKDMKDLSAEIAAELTK